MIRILHVDDNRHDRDLVRDALEKEHGGFELIEAASRAQFEARLAEGGYDVVLSDFNILGFQGLEVIDAVHAKNPQMPVVIVTGTGSEETAVEALKRGAADYVIKTPRHIQRLPHTLQAVMEKVRLGEERKRAEEENAALAQRDGALVQALGQIVYDWRPLTDELYWEGDYTRLLGYSSDEIGHDTESWTSRVHPDDLRSVLAELKHAQRERRYYNLDYRFRHRDGTYRWMHDSGVLFLNTKDELERIIGIFVDITERKQAEETLQQAEEKYRSIFENTVEGIFQRTRDGRFLTCNPALARMYGYDSPRELAASVTNIERQLFVDQRDAKEFQALIERAGVVQEFESEVYRKDRSKIWVSVNARAVRDQEGGVLYYQGTVVDITERKQKDEALKSYAQRLAALSRRLLEIQETERRHIARELHDEIGQGLTALNLSLEARKRLSADAAKASLDQATELIRELIARTRDLSLNLRPAMLDDFGLLATLLWYFKRYSDLTQVQVRFEHENLENRLPPEIETAAYRILQEALTNVTRHAQVNDVYIRAWRDQNKLGLIVQDKGKGFDPARALALPTSSGIAGMIERAQLLGGTLRIDSAPGAGTLITADMPLETGAGQ